MRSKTIWLILFAVAGAAATWAAFGRQQASVQDALSVPQPPRIRPDYAGIVIPANIAPLNFRIEEPGVRFLVEISSRHGEMIGIATKSPNVAIPARAWRTLLESNRGNELRIVVYTDLDGRWRRHAAIVNRIAEEDIDGHLAYRLIGPVYNKWRDVGIYQRELATYREAVVLDGKSLESGCVNCHSFANNDPERMLIGVRSARFGNSAILATDGEATKIDAKFGYTAWHPSGRLAVYSMNMVWQFFHAAGPEVRDVIDLDSALAYYLADAKNVKMVPGAADKARLETYPAWSPDGKQLYYCSAPILWEQHDVVPPPRFAEVKYDLMRIGYDVEHDRWSDPETVLSAEETGLSILLPRVSPDSRFLLFCMCDYGCFPIYQPSSDLYMMDLTSGEYAKLEVNSEFSESWHSWSSNSRWIAFSSRRRDGHFTRCYLSAVDQTGRASKPFLLPQRDPEFYDSFLKTVSVPELITGPIPVAPETLVRAARSSDGIAVDALSGASKGAGAAEPWQTSRE